MKRVQLLAAITIILLSFLGCEKDNVKDEMTKEINLETLSVQKGSYRVATLSGRISGLDYFAPDFEYGIEYSTNLNFFNGIRKKVLDKYSEDTFSITLTDVIPDQKYFYRVYYINEKKAYYSDIKDFCYTWDYPVSEVVDLGLCVNWASFNVGASNPNDLGFPYAWGKTDVIIKDDNKTTRSYINLNNTKGGYNDAETTLNPENDVARIKWKDNWRMPTVEEWNELRDNCSWTWTNLDGMNGYLITSNIPGYTERSVFLPATDGYIINDIMVSTRGFVGDQGYYWSSSFNKDNGAYYLYFSSDYMDIGSCDLNNLIIGYFIRPVCPSDKWISHISMSLNRDSLFLTQGGNYNLKVTVSCDGTEYSYHNGFKWSSDNPSVATVDDNGFVHAISNGIAHIAANIDTVSVQCTVTVFNESEIEHEYVDLGLSVKWATFNVGALSPEETGGIYAWGETEQKDEYDWASYKWCYGSPSDLTKYCYKSERGYEGFTDTKTYLDPEDDVAHVKWGGDWRMPSKQEQDELRMNCKWTFTTVNGVEGYIVRSKKTGYTDRSIFLPLVDYWSSSLNIDEILWTNTEQAYLLDLHSAIMVKEPFFNRENRCKGLSVRPVCP